jgi:predicted deacylase
MRQTVLRFDHPLLAGLEHPCFEARGAADGPRVSIIGGIHGCEYSSIAAVIRLMRSLDVAELSGSIVAVPVVSLESFRARSPFVVPVDGQNLNRAFPGRLDGGYTEALARSIFDTLIAPADAFIDLHGGDMVEALEPFTIYDESAVEERSRALALAFGMRYVVRQPATDAGLSGMTCTAAAAAGVPSVMAEAGGCGRLEEHAVELLVRGTRNALRVLGMLPGEPDPPPPDARMVGSFRWQYAARAGWWESAVQAGDEVAAGALLGRVLDLHGNELEEIRAPAPGVVLFLTTSPAVGDRGLLLGLGADLS